jgi:hypothetical protein
MIANVLAVPADYNGSVIIESKEVNAGSSFTVKVYLAGNDMDLTSMRIPLTFNGMYFTCTYVDFTGSIKHSEMEGNYIITDNGVEISYIPPIVNPLPTIGIDSGLIATLYFTVSGSAPGLTYAIDSVNEDIQFGQFGSIFHRWRRVETTIDDGSGSLIPAFMGGAIVVHSTTDVEENENNLLPSTFALAQNYPNPFNPSTTIPFSLPNRAYVKLEVFNVLGQTVAVLADGVFGSGPHLVSWDAVDTPSGLYFYRLSANSKMITKKMILLK